MPGIGLGANVSFKIGVSRGVIDIVTWKRRVV